jgi:hypothetical protein
MRRKVIVGRRWALSIEEADQRSSSTKARRNVAAKRVAVGKKFDARINLSGDVVGAMDATTRALLVRVFLAVAAILLLGSAGLGLYSKDFSAFQAVWAAAGPLYGFIAVYFFTPK